MGTSASIGSADRLEWIDAARGLAIIAVVLMHVSTWIFLPYVSVGRAHDLWADFSGWLSPVRMPTLMLISGVLLSKRIRGGWRNGSLRGSIFASWYLYIVWLSLFGLVAAVGVWTGVQSFESWVTQLVLPQTILWYIAALAFWAAVLATVRNADPGLILLLMAAVSVSAFFMAGGDGIDQYLSVMRFGFFFAVGVYARPWILSLFYRRSPWTIGGVAIAVFAVLLFIAQASTGSAVAAIVFPAEGLAAAIVVLALAQLLTRLRPLRSALMFLGQRTAPVYVLHAPLMVALSMIPGWAHFVAMPVAKAFMPLLLAAVLIAICILVYAAARRTPLRALFEAPPSLSARVVRVTRVRTPRVVPPAPALLQQISERPRRDQGATS